MAKRKVPSQASSGADTFNDNLVGRQITNGTSSLANTVFELDNSVPEKDVKSFRTIPFSDFLTLDTLKVEETTTTKQKEQREKRKKSIRFKKDKNNADRSLYGSLKSRILVSLTNIINEFPGGIDVQPTGPISNSNYSASGIYYQANTNRTTFYAPVNKFFNPFEISLTNPNTLIETTPDNELRNLYSSFKKYVVVIDGVDYPILDYSGPNSSNLVKITINGDPFNGQRYYSDRYLIRPNNAVIEEFFANLDDLEAVLLNRESSPIYTANFQVPKEDDEHNGTSFVNYKYSWPVSDDGWNLQITGLEYNNYITNLSDVSDGIDEYKSNLMVRFLAAPQLFEFDSDDKRIESIFQLYGQSFDSVKKYIDNIANMRNVSYNGINNLPDVLLKNLAENLGLDTKHLFDEKSLEESVYIRQDSNYEGIPTGFNLVDAEYEFYRRLLVNLAYIFKSKGTRSAIVFFLKFLGAPEPLIKLDEYVYNVISIPETNDLQGDIYDVINGGKVFESSVFNTDTYLYEKVSTTGLTNFDREGYPVDETTGLPRKAYNDTDDVFFAKGSGWYDITLDHRSETVIDVENSVLTGRTKTIKTKNKPYTFGENYFDTFRTLPGLEIGFGLQSAVDNRKSGFVEEGSSLVMNRKNISINVSASQGLDYDIYRKSRELEISFGIDDNLLPQTGVTFAEFLDKFIHTTIKNSNVMRYKKNYPTLEEVYRDYMSQSGFTPYNFITTTEFVNKMSPYWPQLIEQIIPATTQWLGGNLIENGAFGRPKYQYKRDCQPLEFNETLYPDFITALDEDLESALGEEDNFRELLNITEVTYYPIIEIDGVVHGGPTYTGLTTGMTVTVSGNTTTTDSAKLFDLLTVTGCTCIDSDDPEKLALICEYKDYLDPDVPKIQELWNNALVELLDSITVTRNSAGYEDYDPYLNTTGQTYSAETLPVLNYEFYTDSDGVEKIKFSSIKYGSGDCSVGETFAYRLESEYNISVGDCTDDWMGVEVFVDDIVYCDEPVDCILQADVKFRVLGNKVARPDGGDWPFYIYANCVNSYNENAAVTIEKDDCDDCTFRIPFYNEYDVVDINILDEANNEVKFRIEGLTTKIVDEPCPAETGDTFTNNFTFTSYQGSTGNTISTFTGGTICDDFPGYVITPKVAHMNNFNYGIGCESTVLVLTNTGVTINSDTTKDQIESYIGNGVLTGKTVCDIEVDDFILSATLKECKKLPNQNFQDIDEGGLSFTYTYDLSKLTDKECLTSIRKSSITGKTADGSYEVIEVLPTTQLRVYTNKKIEDFGVVTNTTYHLDDRFPEELQVLPTDFIEPCCNHPKELYNHGDYLINQYGELLEVVAVDLNYCEPDLFFNLNFEKEGVTYSDEYVVVFNGNSSEQVLMKHQYETHPNIDFKLQQYYTGPDCPDKPTIQEMEQPPYNCDTDFIIDAEVV